jgi:hypothetical protein
MFQKALLSIENAQVRGGPQIGQQRELGLASKLILKSVARRKSAIALRGIKKSPNLARDLGRVPAGGLVHAAFGGRGSTAFKRAHRLSIVRRDEDVISRLYAFVVRIHLDPLAISVLYYQARFGRRR